LTNFKVDKLVKNIIDLF